MQFDTSFLKRNWYYLAAAAVGIFVIYELLSRSGGGSSSGSSGFVGASGQPISDLQAGADVAASNNNAQIVTAQIAGQVASNQAIAAMNASEAETNAKLQLGLAQTAAARDVSLATTSADVQKTALTTQGAVDIQSIVTGGAVQQTAIEANAITTVAATQASVAKAQIDAVQKQITTLLTYSKHFGSDIKNAAPAFALELGQGYAAPGIASAVVSGDAAKTASITGAISSFGSNLLKGLFGGL